MAQSLAHGGDATVISKDGFLTPVNYVPEGIDLDTIKILTRQADYKHEGVDVVATTDAALELAGDVDEVMIIGGGKVYEQMLPKTDCIYLTRVHADFDGDTFFPEIKEDDWRIVASEPLPANDERPFSISFQTLERIT